MIKNKILFYKYQNIYNGFGKCDLMKKLASFLRPEAIIIF